MQSENLLRTECGGGYDSDDGTGGGLRGGPGVQYSAYHHQYNVQIRNTKYSEDLKLDTITGTVLSSAPTYTL